MIKNRYLIAVVDTKTDLLINVGEGEMFKRHTHAISRLPKNAILIDVFEKHDDIFAKEDEEFLKFYEENRKKTVRELAQQNGVSLRTEYRIQKKFKKF